MKQGLLLTAIILLVGISDVMAQVPETREAYEKEYQRRIRKEMLNGVYIPKDLTDAFKELNRLSDKAAKEKFKSGDEDVVAKKLYFSLGRWIVHNWGFRGGSRLSHWLKTNLGLSHPEDQALFIIRTYHRSLNKKPLNVKELVQRLKEDRHKEIMKSKKIIKSETRKVPKPDN